MICSYIFLFCIIFTMNIFEIIISSVGLASDAFAVSISKGLSFNKIKLKNCFIVAMWFGLFQSLMYLFGYILSDFFYEYTFKINHYISFILLFYIGFKMIYDSFKYGDIINNSLGFCEMFIFSIATSIDSFSFGMAYSLGYGKFNFMICLSLIGLITFGLSFVGTLIGSKVGDRIEKLSKIFGGIILIGMAFNVLIDHLL